MGRRGGVVMCSYFEQKFVYMAYDAGSWCIFRLFQAGIFCRAPEIPQYRSWRSTCLQDDDVANSSTGSPLLSH